MDSVIEISSANLSRLLSDAEKLKDFGVSDIDCLLSKEKFVMRASTTEEADFRVKATHSYSKMGMRAMYPREGEYVSGAGSSTHHPEPACICSVFRPEDFTEGNYRCVTPGDLIKPLRAAKQILSKGIFGWKTIQLGMDENFYIRIRGCVYKEFEFHIKSEPDVVKYEDEEPDSDDDEYGYETKMRRLDWRSNVICG